VGMNNANAIKIMLVNNTGSPVICSGSREALRMQSMIAAEQLADLFTLKIVVRSRNRRQAILDRFALALVDRDFIPKPGDIQVVLKHDRTGRRSRSGRQAARPIPTDAAPGRGVAEVDDAQRARCDRGKCIYAVGSGQRIRKSHMPIKIIPGRSTCPACGRETDSFRHKSTKKPKLMIMVAVCGGCGSLLAMADDGELGRPTVRLRFLTSEEKRRLPQHNFAAEIRARQEEIVSRMIG